MAFKKIVGFLFVLHAVISIIRYRKYLIFNNGQTDFHIPLDILVELFFGVFLNLFMGIVMDRPFKNIHEFPSTKSYDQSINRQNFRVPSAGRPRVLLRPLKDRIGNLDFNK